MYPLASTANGLLGFVTTTSTAPAAWAPVTAVRVDASTKTTPVAGTPPIETLGVAWKLEPVITIGVDSPHLDLARLREAADALAGGVDVVLGPAADGGYYLIGLREPSSQIFRDIAWSSAGVLDATLARARDAGMRVRLLQPTFDVDDVDGLRALRDVLARGEVLLPRTLVALTDALSGTR